MSIDFKHEAYKNNINKWQLTEGVCEGEDVADHLVQLNPTDKGAENVQRNSDYRERAVFYPIAGRTVSGLTDLMFSKKPKLEVPAQLEYMRTNCDGTGVSIFQQSQDVSNSVVKIARSSLLVTYPKVDRELSKADMDTGNYFPTIKDIDASQVINWDFTSIGSVVKLSLVVIEEEVTEVVDYERTKIKQIRELKLTDNVFSYQLWRENDKYEWVMFEDEVFPKDGRGESWDEILFQPLGALANTMKIDRTEMYDLAKMNIGHYRNSADYEDNIYFIGQSQAYMTGMTQTHVDLMKKNKMYMGGRTLIGVPSGEKFGFEGAKPNTMVRQAMIDKIEGMIGIGARFIQPSGKVKTATESSSDTAISTSMLAMIAGNVSDGYIQALKWCARYLNIDDAGIEYKINDVFVQPNATAQEIAAMVSGFISGGMTIGAYFNWLKRMGIEDDEKSLEEFSQEVGGVEMPNLDEPQ